MGTERAAGEETQGGLGVGEVLGGEERSPLGRGFWEVGRVGSRETGGC